MPRGVGQGRALSRATLPGAAADAGPLSLLPPGRWWPTVTQRPAQRHELTSRLILGRFI